VSSCSTALRGARALSPSFSGPPKCRFQFVSVVLGFLTCGPEIAKGGFEIRVSQKMLDSACVYPGTMQTTGKCLSPLVQAPFSANCFVLTGDLFPTSPCGAIPAIQSRSESKFLQITQKMTVGLAVCIRENQEIGPT